MGAQAVLLGIVLCVEDDSTSESREPKNGGKQNAFVLLPSGHGGSRTLILTPYGERAPFYMSCDSFSGLPRLAESRQERTDALVLVLTQLFHRWIKIYDRQLGELKI